MSERVTCTYCGMEGHRASRCPRRPRERDIDAAFVRQRLSYDPDTGVLTWRPRSGVLANGGD